VTLNAKQQLGRFLKEGKLTNNRVRLLKAENAALAAELKKSQRQLESLAFVDYRTLEDFMVKSLGPHNNREEIRRNQDEALMKEIVSQTATPLPAGFKPGMFMYAPADVMIVLGEKGEVNFALAELNAQSYDGTTTVPPKMHEAFMRHYHRIGADWAKEHKETSPDKPLLIIFGGSGREGEIPENSRGMADKMIYGQKMAQGAGSDCRCISADNAEHLYNKEIEKQSECARKGVKYTEGEFWPLKSAVIVGYNPDFIKKIQAGRRTADGKTPASLYGVDVTHVMSDRLTHYIKSQVPGLDNPSFKYCNITMPEGNDKDQTFTRQEEYNNKMLAEVRGFDAGGLEKSVLHGTIHRDPSKDLAGLAEDFYQACKAASDQEVQNGKSGNIVTKSTGTAKGAGVTLIRREDIEIAREIFLQHIIPEVKPYVGEALGFPYAVQSFFTPNVVDGKVPEIRIVPHVVELEDKPYMVACPTIIKTGPVPKGDASFYEVEVGGERRKVEHLKKSNVGTADKKLTKQEMEGRDYLSALAQAGCNLANLEKYGVTKDLVIKASKYVAGLAAHAVEVNMGQAGLQAGGSVQSASE